MAAAAFGAQFAAQSFASFAAPTRSGACDSGQPTPGERQRRSDSPTLAELRAAAEAGTPLVREETPDSDLEREEEAEAERIRIAAEEEAARLYREERDRLKKIAEEEERQRKRAEDRAKRAREKEERALRRAAEKLARAQAAEKAFEEWKAGEERVTFEDGSTYVGEFRARRRDSDWEDGLPRLICRHGRGVFHFANGSIYDGDFHNDVMYGNGVAKYSDGTHAEGWWEGGHLLKGSLNKPAEGEYSGEFEDGRFHGHGCMNYANGSSYVGEWKMGRRAGQGTYKYSNGDAYDGEWKDNACHGAGQLIKAKHSCVYDGVFVKGKKHGQGTQTYSNGAVYVGEWAHGHRGGYGRITHKHFEYEGHWAHDQKHGEGVARWLPRVSPDLAANEPVNGCDILGLTTEESLASVGGTFEQGCALEAAENGAIRAESVGLGHGNVEGRRGFQYEYKGNFHHGLRHGQGELKYPTGESYAGAWEKNVRHGAGILNAEDFTYEGEFQLDRYHGAGTYVCLRTLSIYAGEFAQGVQHGRGKITTKENSVMEGLFFTGKAHGPSRVVQEFDDARLTCKCNYVAGQRRGAARIECIRTRDLSVGDSNEILVFHAQYGSSGDLQSIVTVRENQGSDARRRAISDSTIDGRVSDWLRSSPSEETAITGTCARSGPVLLAQVEI